MFKQLLRRNEVMKIAVFGVTGPSGLQVVKEALERGHEVTAIVRNPAKMTESVPRRETQGMVICIL